VLETARYTEAANFEGYKVTMQEEKKIIEKDVGCNVVDAYVHDLYAFQNKSGDDVKTTFYFVFSFGRVVSVWSSKKQEGITQSSTKDECVSAAIDQKTWPTKFCHMKVGKMRLMLGFFQEKYQGGVLQIDIFLFCELIVCCCFLS